MLIEIASRFRQAIESIVNQPSSADLDDRAWDELRSWLGDLDRELAVDPAIDELTAGVLADMLAGAADGLRRVAPADEPAMRCQAELLDFLARLHRRCGNYEVARELDVENLSVRQSLAAVSDEPWDRVGVASALGGLSRSLYLLERHHEALAAAQEAVKLVRKAGEAGHPVAHTLAWLLSDLQLRLAAVDRLEEALSVAQDVVGIQAELRLEEPSTDPAGLIDALDHVACRLRDLDRFAAACDRIREAATYLRQAAAQGSVTARSRLAGLLQDLSYCAERAGQWPEAVAAAQEEIALRRQIPADEGGNASQLAYTLQNLAHLYHGKNRYDDAFRLAGEAIVLYRQCAATGELEIDDYTWFVYAIDLVYDTLVANRKYKAALEAARERVDLLRYLAGKRPAELTRLAGALDRLADISAAVGKRRESRAASAQARTIWTSTAD